MNIEKYHEALPELQMLLAEAGKVGESLDFYNETLNKLALTKATFAEGYPLELEVQEAIDSIHLSIALFN